MEITVSLQDQSARGVALARARDAYSARNPPLDEQQFLQKLVNAQLDSLVASYVQATLSRLSFMQRFTADERVAIRQAAQVSPSVDDYLKLLEVSEQVDITHPLTVAGVQQLEAGGLLAQGRAAEILAL